MMGRNLDGLKLEASLQLIFLESHKKAHKWYVWNTQRDLALRK